MGKTTKEKAKEWGCSDRTVRDYCASGIIPPAEQLHGKWDIPDEWPKPPMTRHKLCFLMDTVYQLNHGSKFDDIRWGFSDVDVIKGFNYLLGAVFISNLDTKHLAETLKDAIVTPRGAALIAKENEVSKVKFKAHITAKADLGPVSLEIGGEISNQ